MLLAFLGDIHLRNYNLNSRLTDYNTALFNKLEFVYKTCIENRISYLYMLGDLNTILDTDIKDSVKNQFITLAKKYKDLHKLTIAGNHDLPSNDISNLYKTSLYTMALANAYDIITVPQDVGDFVIQPLDVDIKETRKILQSLKDPNKPMLLLGHHLFNWELNPESGLTDTDF